MTPTIKTIKAALAAATPGPWKHVFTDRFGRHICDEKNEVVISTNSGYGSTPKHENATLIANSPAWLAWLIGEVERRDEVIASMVARCGCTGEHGCDACAEARKEIKG